MSDSNERFIEIVNEVRGNKHILDWCKEVNITKHQFLLVATNSFTPINKLTGKLTEIALRILDAVHCVPEDLWDNEVLYPLETNFCEFDSIDKDVLQNSSEDFRYKCPSEYLEDEQLADLVQEAIESLYTERQKDVIRRRFGINHDREYPLSEIGDDYGVTRTSIMNTEAKALRMLRHPLRCETLRLFLYPYPAEETPKRIEKPITKPIVIMSPIHASKGEMESFERAKGFIEHAMKEDKNLDDWPELKCLYYKL